MPFSLYQMQVKFRDEPRPRFGLIRTREFEMKDAYTFDIDEEGCNAAYQKQFQAYKNIMPSLTGVVQEDSSVLAFFTSTRQTRQAPDFVIPRR